MTEEKFAKGKRHKINGIVFILKTSVVRLGCSLSHSSTWYLNKFSLVRYYSACQRCQQNQLFLRDQTAYAIFHYGISLETLNQFVNSPALFSLQSPYQSIFSSQRWCTCKCRVTSLMTCIQFRLFIKEYLNTDTNLALTCIWRNRVILRRTVAKWWCIKLCTFFFWGTLYIVINCSTV